MDTFTSVSKRAVDWYDRFNRLAGDLYPGRYTRDFCLELAEVEEEVRALAGEKLSTIVAHNYQVPELQESAHFVGDSIGLMRKVRALKAYRVDFSSVHFMGATAKIGNLGTRVFVQGDPDVHSCSLVRGTNHAFLDRLKKRGFRTEGGEVKPVVFVTYVNSDVRTKAISEYICTSGNAAAVIARACRENPDHIVYVLPDKFLGYVMKWQAVESHGVDPAQIEVYSDPFNGYNACCYVHEKIGNDAPERALELYADAELLLHPECGCASSCLLKLSQGKLPRDRVYYRSTEGMLERVRESPAKTFVIGTELGMIYRLRKLVPDRTFVPISQDAVCDFMKQNTLGKLAQSLRHDRYELLLDDSNDPRVEWRDGDVIRIDRAAADAALAGIERMLETM